MPVIANNLSIAAGATSVNVFDNTNYQFVNEGTEIRVSSAVVGANDGAQGSNVNYRFTINNTEFADDAIVPTLVTGQPFTDGATSYRTNSVVATGQSRNRPLLTFRNNTYGSTGIFRLSQTSIQNAMERYIYHGKSAHRLSLSLLWAFLTLRGQLHHSACQTNANALAVWPRTVYTISNINHRLSTCDGLRIDNHQEGY